MKKERNKEKLSLNDFKMWLKGLEDFAGGNWTPNKDQWLLIKEKLFSIQENAVGKTTHTAAKSPNFSSSGYVQSQTSIHNRKFQKPVSNPNLNDWTEEDEQLDQTLIKLSPPVIPKT